ncbi:MAG: hypothetical protein KAS32_07400 [Candidatus Peribacteraceae bacterium]|nr:hypothetical protein [Candidatus Peribacteraceae bacterium]
MLGFMGSEGSFMIEIWPIFGGEKGIPDAAQFRFKRNLPEKYWGEFGIGVNKTTIYVMWDISTYPIHYGTIRRQIKYIVHDIQKWRKRWSGR